MDRLIMPAEGFCLRFFWGPRRESARKCAERLASFLPRLAKIDPIFRDWAVSRRRSGRTAEEIGIRNVAQLEKLFKLGVNREEVYPYRPIRSLGYSMHPS